MKNRPFILLLGLLLLNSCIVKSLFPFYTDNSISFEQRFIGIWYDDKDNKCEVFSFRDLYLKDRKKTSPDQLTAEDLKEFNKYKNGYYVELSEGDKMATFVAIPFKVQDQIFLDFSLFDVDMASINTLASSHLVGMHTLVKMEFNKDFSAVNLKWFGEKKLNQLLEEDRIKIKHEKVGVNDSDYILTATSEELQKFISKYMDSDEVDKWATEIEYNFKQ
jgi:hypothetical protein